MNGLDVDVLIVGGGPCGLFSSLVLSDLGVEHLLVERRRTVSPLPKGHFYNQRTMEIFRQHGVADSIYAVGMPTANAKVRYVTSLGGDGPLDRREIFTFDAFGGGPLRQHAFKAAPGPSTHLPQTRLEPILRGIAENRQKGRMRFGHEMTAFEQHETGVRAIIRDLESGEDCTVRAQYLIAADGGKTVAPALGVRLEGVENLATMCSVHMSADLSAYTPGDALITQITDLGGEFHWSALVPMGPRWGKECREWAFFFAFFPDNPKDISDEALIPTIRKVLKIPDLPIVIRPLTSRKATSEWVVERVVAARFRIGRVFLAGDSAHRHVPTGGLGLNSGIQDAHNLCWKLAAVLKGKASDRLLDSYDAERRAADLRNADWALFAFMNHAIVDSGLGFMPGASPQQNAGALSAYFSDTPLGRTLRARAHDVIGTMRVEYCSLNIELGAIYESAAVVSDGSPAPAGDPMGGEYVPTTRPGHRLPHAWLFGGDGWISTHDLIPHSRGFALITGVEGDAWCAAAAAAGRTLGIDIKAVRLGIGGDYTDRSGWWDEASAIASDGAILVRPDNVVGFRSISAVADPEEALTAALAAILAIATPTEPASRASYLGQRQSA